MCGCITLDPFEWRVAKYFCLYVLSFSGGTFCNIKVLQDANVETVRSPPKKRDARATRRPPSPTYRPTSPAEPPHPNSAGDRLPLVCLFDRLFHNRELPGVRSCVALGMIVAGALSYIANDRDFRLSGLFAYRWAIAWWVLLVFNLTLGKFLVSGLQQR